MKNIAIFASGKGTNFIAINKAINKHLLDANISLFVSDRKNSKGLRKAIELKMNTYSFSSKEYESKKLYEQEILIRLKEYKVDLIVLAGYMRIIGETILNEYENRIINIHPSLLPLFKGKDAIGQALRSGNTHTGVTVHFVDEGIDTGKIIIQKKVAILEHYNREMLEEAIHKMEHDLYYIAIKKVLEEIK